MTGKDLLISGAKELGVDLEPGHVNSIFMMLAELEKWNKKINLTTITAERDVIIKHILDSLSYFKGFEHHHPKRLLDMGSGAGFPAFPIKILRPDLAVSMVESVKKKASYLRHISRLLKLQNVEIIDRRLDDLPPSYTRAFDTVTARAFASMPTGLTTGARFLGPEGRIVLSRGPEEEISEGAITEYGFVLEKKTEIKLPFSDIRRSIWTFQKL